MRLPSRRPVWIVWSICLGLAALATYRTFDSDRHPTYAGNVARMVQEMSYLPSNSDLPITPLVLLDFMPGRWPGSGTMDETRVTEIERLIDARSAAVFRSDVSDLGFQVQLFNEAAGIVGPNALCTVAPPGFDRMSADLDRQMAALFAELGLVHGMSARDELAVRRFDKRLDAKPREECAGLLAFMAVGVSMGKLEDADMRLKLRLRAAALSGSAADWAAVRELDDRMLAVFRVLIELSQAVAKSNDVGQEARRLVDERLEQADTVWKQEAEQKYRKLFFELSVYISAAACAAYFQRMAIRSAVDERRKKRAMSKAALLPSMQRTA